MTAMEFEKLNEARTHWCDGNDAEAVGCYGVVAAENPENPEAKFFMCYMDWLEDMKEPSERKTAVIKLINSLENAVNYVAAADCTKTEKLAVIKGIVDLYTPVPGYAINLRISPIGETIETGVLSLYWLGSYIKDGFKNDSDAMKLAIIPWKEGVKLQQQWYSYKYEGNKAEDYVAEIQKVDPAYTMPKKAGCISLG